MEVKARASNIRISPRKARQITDIIKGKDIQDAKNIVAFTPKKAAKIVGKVLDSAIANAENNNDLDRETLYIKRAFVDQGPTMKRVRPRAQGRATLIRKRSSHITVILEEKEG